LPSIHPFPIISFLLDLNKILVKIIDFALLVFLRVIMELYYFILALEKDEVEMLHERIHTVKQEAVV